MNAMVLVAANWFDIIVPAIFLIIWLANNVFKGLAENNANEQKRMAAKRAAGEQPPQRQEPQKELERFLEELGVKKPQPANPPPRKPTPLPRREQIARPKQTVPPPKPPQPRESVVQRHLTSDLETRRQIPAPSRLEETHLGSKVAARSLGSSDMQTLNTEPTPPPAMEADFAPTGLQRMLQNKTLLARTFILSQVLDQPVGFRHDPYSKF